jgi:hypothetical protein
MVTGSVPRKGNSLISGSASGAGALVGTLAGYVALFLSSAFLSSESDRPIPPTVAISIKPANHAPYDFPRSAEITGRDQEF